MVQLVKYFVFDTGQYQKLLRKVQDLYPLKVVKQIYLDMIADIDISNIAVIMLFYLILPISNV